jgi:hypothetical protein
MATLETWNGAITFGTTGNYRNWARTGWSTPEAGYTWMEGYQATLEFGMPTPATDPVLAAQLVAVRGKARQQMLIYLNGRFVGLFTAMSDVVERWTITIPQEYFASDFSRNLFSFACPNAMVPAEEGVGADQRRLSFAFVELALREAVA